MAKFSLSSGGGSGGGSNDESLSDGIPEHVRNRIEQRQQQQNRIQRRRSDSVPDPSAINQDDEMDTSTPDSGKPTNPNPQERSSPPDSGSSSGNVGSDDDVPDPSDINQDDELDTSTPDSGSPTNPNPRERQQAPQSSSGSGDGGGDVFSGAVDTFEGTTGVDVPGEGSAIEQGKDAVESGSDTVSKAGVNVVGTVTGSRQQGPFTGGRDPLRPTKTRAAVNVEGHGSVAEGAFRKSTESGDFGGFGPEAEPENVIESRIPDDGDLLEGTSPGVRDFGRTVLGAEAPDKDITDSLTEGDGSTPFTLTEEEQEQARKGAENYREFFGVGEEAEQVTKDLTGSDKAATIAGGLGEGVGDLASAPRAAPLLVDTGIRTTVNISDTVKEEGALDTGEAIANTAFSSARGGVESFNESPLRTTGRIAGGFVAGAAVTRGASAARTSVRSRRVKRRSDSEVDFEDITSDDAVGGERNPRFDTDPDAPTQQAKNEFATRAADNPDVAAPGNSGSAVFHTTDSDISGSRGARNRVRGKIDDITPGKSADIEVGEGRSELPGLWGASDASNLGLQRGSSGSSWSVGLTRPRLRGGKSDQVVSLPGDDIRAMPDDATGYGYELRQPDGTVAQRGLGRGQAKDRAEGTNLEVRPQSDTAGYKFLTEEAEPGSIYVRPPGSRTPELEGVAPPGSQFVEEGITAVNMPGRSVSLPGGRKIEIPGTGRTIPMRRFDRMDSNVDGGKAAADVDDITSAGTDVDSVTAYELPSSRGRSVTPGQQSAAGGYLGGGTSAVSGGGSSGTSMDSDTIFDSAAPTDFDSSTGGSGSGGGEATGPGSSPPGGSGSGSGFGGSGSGGGSTTGGSTGGSSFGGGSSGPPTTGGGSSGPPTTGGGSSGPPTTGTPTSPPSRPPLPSFDSDSKKKRRNRDLESFERTFEFDVADPDDILEGTLADGTAKDIVDLSGD